MRRFGRAGATSLLWAALAAAGESATGVSAPSYTKPPDEKLREALSAEQYEVTQKGSTERAFRNAYWDHHEPGIYVDIVSGEPLFSSLDKFDSGTGWPSFTRPLERDNVVERSDGDKFFPRTEVRSKHGDSHLGHVFDDGPRPTGIRYCINSAALRFVPVAELEQRGYGRYRPAFAAAGAAPQAAVATNRSDVDIATFAGGCFWGVEQILREIPGVIETTVGYTGGLVDHPSYDDVSEGNTGHAEAVQMVFDPARISYEEILAYFFRLHDPTTLNRQHGDVGAQYRSAIFFRDERQREIAQRVKARVDASGKFPRKVVTQIVPASRFWPAEEYHQDYLRKNPGGYNCHALTD